LAVATTSVRAGGGGLPELRAAHLPPRDLCPDCGEEARELYHFSGRGEVYSFTTVYQAPAGFEQEAPYPMAMVRLEEGPLVTAQLTDLGDRAVQIGMPVEMVTRKLRADGERGMLVYGYKFRPLLNGKS
jgi:uncharacterized OB-fold protein